MKPINLRIAEELGVREQQVAAAISLLDGGATVPFVARYRKEATGGLDEVQLRDVRDRAAYLREMAERRDAILKSIEEQGKLDPALKARIEAAKETGLDKKSFPESCGYSFTTSSRVNSPFEALAFTQSAVVSAGAASHAGKRARSRHRDSHDP